jgi:beta-glucosidase
MHRVLLLAILCLPLLIYSQDYKNPKLPASARVKDLLKRMTLEEKVAQLRSTHASNPRLTDEVLNDAAKMDSLYGHGVGMINPDFDATMEQTIQRRNALQHYLKTKTRLGIPALFIDEAHHGLLAPGSDVFPTSIALASSWDTALVRRVYIHIAHESSIKGTRYVLAPVVDVCRDPRWGRTSETYGEDPFLCGIMGSAVVQGYQGSANGTIAKGHVAAILKHFTGHGEPEAGVNQAPANYSLRTLREMHMEPFRICINKAKPAGVMASYVDIDGVPSHANAWLLKDVLRKEWKYKGLVVSDWWGIDQLWNKHRIALNEKDAARKAFNAGVTIDLPFGNNYAHLVRLVKEGAIKMPAIDSAVSYILDLKFRMRLFEEGDISLEDAKAHMADPKGRLLAREAAEKSIILLKNENNILPLDQSKYKKIAVVGPCAAVNYLGDYSGIPGRNVSLLQGIKDKVGNSTEVVYAPGVQLTTNGDTISLNNYNYGGPAKFPSHEENERLIDEALNVASSADIIIITVGENEQMVREAGGPNRWGDASTLDLLSNQDDLVKAMVQTGKPVIVYLMNGRPLSVNYAAQHANALLEGWFAGEEAGNAVANILFGDVNPSGKLTISIPKSVGQLPVYYNRKPSAHAFEYVTETSQPLYPFGFGLSYTSFQYAAPKLSKPALTNDQAVKVSVTVTNTGNRRGEEIVQLYIHQKTASITRPVKELKGFRKIALEVGETKTVIFTIDAGMLSFWRADMTYGTEPGEVEILTGSNSVQLQKTNLTIL